MATTTAGASERVSADPLGWGRRRGTGGTPVSSVAGSESKQGLVNDMLDWVCEMQKRRKVFSAFFAVYLLGKKQIARKR
ncbi:MAG: hypothetical protein ACYDGZ_18655 [Desulfosporosinus fructosivorans]